MSLKGNVLQMFEITILLKCANLHISVSLTGCSYTEQFTVGYCLNTLLTGLYFVYCFECMIKATYFLLCSNDVHVLTVA